MRAALVLVLVLPTAGCVHLAYEREKHGTARPVVDAKTLKVGQTRMEDALTRLGPPDLALRVGEIDRMYYQSWDGDHLKFDVSLPIPLPSRSASYTLFILTLGSEEFYLARLEFDRQGVLRDLQVGEFTSSSDGQYVAIDNRVMSTFLEDRSRALGLVEEDDDEEDVELDKPR